MCSGQFEANGEAFGYPLDQNQSVVYVVLEGVSMSEAKRLARERAAERTVERGDRYFTIDSETQVQVIVSDQGLPAPGNLYQELIIEGDLGRERLDREQRGPMRSYPALRLVFTMHRTKPLGRGIDACDYTECP